MGIEQRERAYEEYVPGCFFLYCVTAPPPGHGQGTICNSEAVLRSLPPKLRRQLDSTVLTYVVKNNEGKQYYGGGEYTFPVVMDDPERAGRPMLRFTGVSKSTGKEAKFKAKPADLSMTEEELQTFLLTRIRSEKYTIYHEYQAGDLVVVNNHSTLHGREACRQVGERELWRIQDTPERDTSLVPRYWAHWIESLEVQSLFERGESAWACKRLCAMGEQGLELHPCAIVALLFHMRATGDYGLWHTVSDVVVVQRPMMDDALAKLVIEVGQEVSFANYGIWCETLLLESDLTYVAEENVMMMWNCVLKILSLHDDPRKVLAKLTSGREKTVHSWPTMAIAVRAYGELGETEAMRECYRAGGETNAFLDDAFVAGLCASGNFDEAVKFMTSVGAEGKAEMEVMGMSTLARKYSSASLRGVFDSAMAAHRVDVWKSVFEMDQAHSDAGKTQLSALQIGKLVCLAACQGDSELTALVVQLAACSETWTLQSEDLQTMLRSPES